MKIYVLVLLLFCIIGCSNPYEEGVRETLVLAGDNKTENWWDDDEDMNYLKLIINP